MPFGNKTVPIFNLSVTHTSFLPLWSPSKGSFWLIFWLYFYLFFYLIGGQFYYSLPFFSFQDLFSRFTAWIRNLFRVNAVSSVLSPPAVDEASVTKLASQKSLQFPNSSFSEYYMHVQFAFRVPPAEFQWNGVCVCLHNYHNHLQLFGRPCLNLSTQYFQCSTRSCWIVAFWNIFVCFAAIFPKDQPSSFVFSL